MLIWILLAIVAAMLIYIRMAPSEPERWHRPSPFSGIEEKRLKGGYVWRTPVVGDGTDQMRQIDQAAMASERTSRLAGSIEEGQITYLTRTKIIGFPDYTTVSIVEDTKDGASQQFVEVFGRLRFGRSDLGVNTKRIKGWVSALK